ncbi:hypothetical protein LSAT2_027837 [Lamellibrachia satsuma]|nr:hypothetical protein LSAT2_027837 [Lamellibrachia satsuma]
MTCLRASPAKHQSTAARSTHDLNMALTVVTLMVITVMLANTATAIWINPTKADKDCDDACFDGYYREAGACRYVSCFDGYYREAGACRYVSCVDGYYREAGACRYVSCFDGYYREAGACRYVSRFDGYYREAGACRYVSCFDGYYREAGACRYVSCFDGYYREAGACRPKIAVNYQSMFICEMECDEHLRKCLLNCHKV